MTTGQEYLATIGVAILASWLICSVPIAMAIGWLFGRRES